jgi:hypothetical protein
MDQKRKWSLVLLAMIFFFAGQLAGAETGDALQLLSYRAETGFAPNVTDGQIAPVTNPTDWRAAYVRKADFDVAGVFNAPKQTSLLFSNDSEFLYIAVAIPLDNAANGNRLTIYFDQGTPGSLEANGEYYVSMLADGTVPVDGYWNGSAWVQNAVSGVTGIGLRKGSGTPALYNYELKIPLNQAGDASNNYLNITAGDEVGALFVVRMATGGNDEYIWTQTNADNTDPSATGANGKTGWAEIKTIGDGIADRNMVSLAAKGILPTIDGDVSSDNGWKYSYSKNVIFTDYDGNKMDGVIKLKEEYAPNRLIVGVIVKDYAPQAADFLSMYHDQGTNGGERNYVLTRGGDPARDNAFRVTGNGTFQDYNFDTANWVADGTSNGTGAASENYSGWEIEVEIPFRSGDANDLGIDPGNVLGGLFHLYDSANNRNYWLSSTINSEKIVIDPVDPVYNALGWLKVQTGGPFVQSIYPENGDTISGNYPLAVYAVRPSSADPVNWANNTEITYEVRLEDALTGTYTVIKSGLMSKIEDDNISIWTGTLDTWSISQSPDTVLKLVYIVDDGEIDPVSVPMDIYINNDGGITLNDPECEITAPAVHAVLSGSGNGISFTADTDPLLTLNTVKLFIDGELMSTYTPGNVSSYSNTYFWNTSDLKDGEHIIQIWAENSLNISNYSPVRLVYTENDPSVAITAPNASDVVSGIITVAFNATPIAPATLVTTEISVDGGAWTAVTTAPAAAGGNGSHSLNTTLLPDGTHEIIVRTTDNSGRMGYSSDLNIISKNDPSVAITAPNASDVVSGIITVAFNATPIAPATLVTTEISVDGGAWTAVTTAPAAAGGNGSHSLNTTLLPDGTHEIIVRTTDNSGRMGYSSDLNIITDNTEPTGVFSAAPYNVKNGDTVTFDYNGREKNLTAVITITELQKLDSGATAGLTLTDPDGDGVYSAVHTISTVNSAVDGIKTVTLTVSDAAGNIYSPIASLRLDNSDPVVSSTVNPVPDEGKVYQKNVVLQYSYYDQPEAEFVEKITVSHTNSSGFHIGNSPVSFEINEDLAFANSIELVEGYNKITVSVKDKSGNITVTETELTFAESGITTIVGSAGGTVESPDGTKVVIPAGALLSDQEITIQTVNTDALPKPYNGIGLLKKAHKFGPENLIFHKPVQITLAYNGFDLDPDLDGEPNFVENDLESFTLDGSTWLKIKTDSRDVSNGLVTFSTNHFSVYALGNQTETENFKLYWTKNPFKAESTTTAVLELAESGTVSLKIYDLSGDLVRVLADKADAAGTTNIKWDGKNDFDNYVGSGIYIYVFEYESISGKKETVKKPVGVIK